MEVDENIIIFAQVLQIYQAWCEKRIQSRKSLLEEKIVLQKLRKRYRGAIAILLRRRRRRNFHRMFWIQPELRLNLNNKFWETTVPQYPDARFQKKFRLSRPSFEMLCTVLGPYLQKQDTIMREAISVPKRIAVAITVLKGNTDYWTVADLYGIGKSTVGYLLHEFCAALMQHFYEDTIRFPITEDERLAIADGFMEKWQFPDCFGSMDGTHIPILAPPDSPEDYFNYKSFHSLVALVAVDHKYRFIYANVGAPGRCNDASVFRRSGLFRKFSNENPQLQMKTNLHIISDAAFPLLLWVMKPYPITNDMSLLQKNYNYRLSRARMTVENAFGRLKGRWRILLKRADLSLENMKRVIKVCLILHNICESENAIFYPEWAQAAAALGAAYGRVPNIPVPENRAPAVAKIKRNMLAERLMTDGVSIIDD